MVHADFFVCAAKRIHGGAKSLSVKDTLCWHSGEEAMGGWLSIRHKNHLDLPTSELLLSGYVLVLYFDCFVYARKWRRPLDITFFMLMVMVRCQLSPPRHLSVKPVVDFATFNSNEPIVV